MENPFRSTEKGIFHISEGSGGEDAHGMSRDLVYTVKTFQNVSG